MTSKRVTLQFGERVFTAAKETLDQSPYLQSLTSGQWADEEPFFVDQDGDIFAIILRYLRSGIFPLLFGQSTGFDYGTYALVQQQAEFLGLDALSQWIKTSGYQAAISTSTEFQVYSERPCSTVARAGSQPVSCTAFTSTRQEYVCPRGIDLHMNNRGRCGRQCENAQPPEGASYRTVDEVSFVVTTMTYKYHGDACMAFETKS